MSKRPAETDGFRLIRVDRGNDFYPPELIRFLGDDSPEQLFLLGSPALLRHDLLGFFCSIKCPGNAILKTFDLVRAIREAGIPVISGFHTPMEQNCLDILLRGSQPIVICPARGLERMRPSRKIRDGIESSRILLVSSFRPSHRRPTAESSHQRNRLVAALASGVFVPHAAVSGRTEALCREIIAMGKPVFTVECPDNANLFALGAKPVTADEMLSRWRSGNFMPPLKKATS